MANNKSNKSDTSGSNVHVTPIHQYIHLLNSNTSSNTNNNASFIHTIILKSISDPNVYAGFSDLSSLPIVQKTLLQESSSSSSSSLSSGQALLRTLDLFSFGVYDDYVNATKNDSDSGNNGTGSKTYVTLNDAQELKLKMLTVVSIVQQTFATMGSDIDTDTDTGTDADAGTAKETLTGPTTRRSRRHRNKNKNSNDQKITNDNKHKNYAIVQYSKLQKALHIPNANANDQGHNNDHNNNNSNNNSNNNINNKNSIRVLEDILIQCIYSNLLPTGTKLDQKNMYLRVIPQHSYSSGQEQGSDGAGVAVAATTGGTEGGTSASTSASSAGNSSDYVLCRDIHIASTGTTNTDTNANANGTSSFGTRNDIPNMITKLQTLYNRGENVKSYLKQNLNELNKGKLDNGDMWKKVEEGIHRTKDMVVEKNVKGISGVGSGGNNPGGLAMMMDTEDDGSGDLSRWTGTSSSTGKRQLKRTRGGRSGGGLV